MLTEILAGLEHGKEFLGSGLRIYVHYKMLMSSKGVKETSLVIHHFFKGTDVMTLCLLA